MYLFIVLFLGFVASETEALNTCSKQKDCAAFQYCRYYDHGPDIPALWPPCPHFGLCVCVEKSMMLPNGTCTPVITLNLGDNCSNAINERFSNPEFMRCGTSRTVVCNWPYSPDGTRCILTTTPQPRTSPAVSAVSNDEPLNVSITAVTFQTSPSTLLASSTTTRLPQADDIFPPNVTYAAYLASCDPMRRLLCDQPRQGLCCLLRGPDIAYQQCQCCDPHYTYDLTMNKCRPRVYGDLCVSDEDCNSGLIASTGFECRLGRCRCSTNFEPVDTLYWNETGKSTFIRRICVIQGAALSIPTGQECTMNPHVYSQYNATKICHRRAFCHQCFRDRASFTADARSSQAMGVCREIVCNSDNECQTGMRCNKWGAMVDPPCERGMCDCDASNSIYMDRFSRCSAYRMLSSGDRCIPRYPFGLHHWYQTNEDWEPRRECVEVRGTSHTFLGVIKCQLPNFEEVDGTCIPNNDTTTSLIVRRSFGEACDEVDLRQPRIICDPDKRLFCLAKKCACTESATSPNFIFWDGLTCRSKTLGDPCKKNEECLTGSYYPPTVVGARCFQGVCSCAENFTLHEVNSLIFDNGAYTQSITKKRYCFPPIVTVVEKGFDCHTDSIGFAEDNLLDPLEMAPVLICNSSNDLFCLRCPSDFNPDDETMGICRTYQQLPFEPPQAYIAQCGRPPWIPLADSEVDVKTTTAEATTRRMVVSTPIAVGQVAKCGGYQPRRSRGLIFSLLLAFIFSKC